MFDKSKNHIVTLVIGLAAMLLAVGVLSASAQEPVIDEWAQADSDPEADSPAAPSAPCAGGPTIDGILLDECVVETFTVGGTTKSITVWYTKNTVTATRIRQYPPLAWARS